MLIKLCLLLSNLQHVKDKMEKLANVFRKTGLKINLEKGMRIKTNPPREVTVSVEDKELSNVGSVNYEGSVPNINDGTEDESTWV